MAQRPRRIVFITLFAALTAACGVGAAGITPNPIPTSAPSAIPTSAPSATPNLTPPTGGQANATLTLGNFGQADGPGLSVEDAVAKPGIEPLLVNGILLKAADGMIWLCTALLTSAPPQCAEPRLLVENWLPAPDDGTFVSGEGLHEDAGVRWIERTQLFGVVRPKGPASSS
jgi:hypothetical protein